MNRLARLLRNTAAAIEHTTHGRDADSGASGDVVDGWCRHVAEWERTGAGSSGCKGAATVRGSERFSYNARPLSTYVAPLVKVGSRFLPLALVRVPSGF